MHAVILSAGYGRRLYPLTKATPKALLPVCHKPVIEYILDRLKRIELKSIIIVTNERYYSKFLEWFSNYIPYQPLVLLSDETVREEEKLGAIGDLKFVLKREKIEDDILILVSDMIFTFSLNRFLNATLKRPDQNWIMLFRLKDKKEAHKYGVAVIDEIGRVIRFEEKPANPFSNLVALGIYYMPASKFYLIDRFLREKNSTDAPGEYYYWLMENDGLYGYVQNSGLWIDIGDIEQYQKAEAVIKKTGG